MKARALRDCLIDFINTNNMLGNTDSGSLDLSYYIFKAGKHDELIKDALMLKGTGKTFFFEE